MVNLPTDLLRLIIIILTIADLGEFSESLPGNIGCYTPGPGDVFAEELHSLPGWNRSIVSVGYCQKECRDRGYRFAFLGKGFECYCGDHFVNGSNSDNCNINCIGNPGQICGGEDALSVYTVCRNGTFRGFGECSGTCHCKFKEQPCHQATGRCLNDECEELYQGKECSTCVPGRYNVTHCTFKCGQCSEPTCDTNDGECTSAECLHTYFGPKCDQRCAKCENGCHIETGICHEGGCVKGFKGQFCDVRLENSSKLDVVLPSVVLPLIMVIVIVGIILKRTICKKNKIRNEEIETESSSSPDSIGNANIAFDLEKEQAITVQDVPSSNMKISDLNYHENYATAHLIKNSELKEFIANYKPQMEFKIIQMVSQGDNGECRDSSINSKPFEINRVKLKDIETNKGNYINASFINGYGRETKYVAAQGPTPNTSGNYWRMIWEQNVSTIVMVTNLHEYAKDQRDPYWPDSVEGPKVYRKLRITLKNERQCDGYTVRTLTLIENDNISCQSEITQFHYNGWPEEGLPQRFNKFLTEVREITQKTTTPVVVHCSADVGKTGTFIALDLLRDQAETEGAIDVYNCVKLLRDQRINMVQTIEEYKFLYEAMCDALCKDKINTTI